MRKRLHLHRPKYKLIDRSQSRKLKRFSVKGTHRFNRIRNHPVAIPALALFVLIGALITFIVWPGSNKFIDTSSRIVILTHDGQTETIPTKERTVGAFLSKLPIKLGVGDVVEPSLSTPINQDDFRINIYRARPIEIVDGTNKIFTFSAATTPRSIAQQANVLVYPEDELNIVPTTNFLTNDSIGEQIVIDRATPVNFNLYGTPTVIRTRAKTVGELVEEKKIVLGAGDSIQPALPTPITANLEVFLTHKGTQIQTVTQQIPMPIQTIEDGSLAYGTSAVRQQGSPGSEDLTYQVNTVNGAAVSKTLIQTVIISPPVTDIVAQGTSLSGIKGDMAIAGIAPSDYQYADYIISNESGWCPTKAQGQYGYCPVYTGYVPSTGGYGLCQATPGIKMASFGSDWATNPVTQLEWCNSYAQRTYGSWYNAYVHWVNDHWW